MNHNLLLLTLFVAHCAHGMEYRKPLTEIEKQLVLREAQRIGKEQIIQQIMATPAPRMYKDGSGEDRTPYVSLTTRINPQAQDPLTQLIMQKITKIEKENGYIPETTTIKRKDLGIMTMPTNFLGEKTEYYRKKDKNGAYIEIQSDIFNKEHLLEILNNQ